eukprot:TRINITY_DN4392_c0_g1_i1.p1 TRINITY_DN4392_c0_g1~~TRINITY_DN4392_c0_g1_i1.p1  ORF type:complete len:322 (+),score=107.05 TRINITY_DN4392_c0_g1_i1:131-1096(+)
MIILNEEQIKNLITIEEAIEVNRDSFVQQATGSAIVPDRISIPVPSQEGATLFKPCKIGGGLGLKVVSVRPNNTDFSTVPGYIFLVDDETGKAKAFMDATYLTALRTAAGSAVATDLLSSPSSSHLLVFGAGLQAQVHIEAMLHVRPSIKFVGIWNRTEKRALDLCSSLSLKYPEVKFKIATNTASDVSSADIIVTATNATKPVFEGDLVKAGAHINGIGSFLPNMQEINSETVKKARIVVDTPLATECGDFVVPHQLSSFDLNTICGQLGDLIQGKIKVRNTDQDVTFFKSVGTAVQDISTAHLIFQNAKRKGVGLSVDM